MRITVYAALKDHFEKEFEITGPVRSIEELNQVLIERNEAYRNIMPVCRFAVNDEFIDNDFELRPNDNIHIIPPSSGG